MDVNELTGKIIGAAIEVHKNLGPGLLEYIYKREKQVYLKGPLKGVAYYLLHLS